ncbi:MAG: glycosyltransferase family 39 protein [Candidatus Micrarchaeota archaeon]|nr:glycosyltransferase family 39 protein [Candidatus Micrarchaeota archaeon]
MLSGSLSEYSYTLGISISLIGVLLAVVLGRREISGVLRGSGLNRWALVLALIVVAVFLAVELSVVKPTQLLFFDDAIYQAMGQSLLHTGQAWMCDYGTATACYIGEIFHEPIGLSFNFALAFAAFGVHPSTAYGTGVFLSALSVFLTFILAQLLFRSRIAAAFSALILALSPVLLAWAMPTNSDIAMLAYSILAIIFLVVFTRKKTLWTFAAMLLSLSLLLYMKVLAVLYIPVLLLLYIILDGSNIRGMIKENLKLIKKNALETKPLVILLVFLIALAPSIMFSYMELTGGNYGFQGTNIQDTCTQTVYVASSSISLLNFQYNICANLEFWINAYRSSYVMQSVIITVMAIFGSAVMLMSERRRELAAVALWFAAFFVLYTAFYAGSVHYGVDWRFMLSVIAQVSLLAGFGAACVVGLPLKLSNKSIRAPLQIVAALAVLALIGYAFYTNLHQLAVKPGDIPQAPDARFYEGFVYNDSHMINASCLVFSYDPTLFNINNRTAAQMSYVYDNSKLQQYESQYSCLVADIGYWCYTPNNLCTGLNDSFTMSPIANATYEPLGKSYGFYYLTPKK